jgi:hypothetical protein
MPGSWQPLIGPRPSPPSHLWPDAAVQVQFLNKVLKTPELLDRQELVRLEELLSKGMGEPAAS